LDNEEYVGDGAEELPGDGEEGEDGAGRAASLDNGE
jgi:hypothetical protein